MVTTIKTLKIQTILNAPLSPFDHLKILRTLQGLKENFQAQILGSYF